MTLGMLQNASVVFLATSSLEFLVVRFPVTYAREIMINEWDFEWIKSSEGVHSLGWEGREEESIRKF